MLPPPTAPRLQPTHTRAYGQVLRLDLACAVMDTPSLCALNPSWLLLCQSHHCHCAWCNRFF